MCPNSNFLEVYSHTYYGEDVSLTALKTKTVHLQPWWLQRNWDQGSPDW